MVFFELQVQLTLFGHILQAKLAQWYIASPVILESGDGCSEVDIWEFAPEDILGYFRI